MDRINSRISQVYGYAVCLITVVVMIIATKQVVDAAFDLSDPIRAEGGRMGRSLTNFEVYKMDARREGPRSALGPPPQPASTDSATSDAYLKRMYEAERETAAGNARFRALRSLVGNLLLIALAGALFGMHWRWLRRRDSIPVTT